MTDTPTQKEALDWATETFGTLALSTNERGFRFIEEALEACQSAGMHRSDIEKVVDRVFTQNANPDVHKEIGQTMMTLMCFAEWLGIDLNDALLREWRRIQDIPMEEWERRHKVKSDMGIATPMENR